VDGEKGHVEKEGKMGEKIRRNYSVNFLVFPVFHVKLLLISRRKSGGKHRIVLVMMFELLFGEWSLEKVSLACILAFADKWLLILS